MRTFTAMKFQAFGLLLITIILAGCVVQAQEKPSMQQATTSQPETSVVDASTFVQTAAIKTTGSPVQMIKAIRLESVTPSGQITGESSMMEAPLSGAALDAFERLGFPDEGSPLKVINTITFNEPTPFGLVAGTVRLIEGNLSYSLVELTVVPKVVQATEDVPSIPMSFVKAIVLEPAGQSVNTELDGLSLNDLERLDFSLAAAPLKRISKVMIEGQAIAGNRIISGEIDIFEAGGTYLLLKLKISPS